MKELADSSVNRTTRVWCKTNDFWTSLGVAYIIFIILGIIDLRIINLPS